MGIINTLHIFMEISFRVLLFGKKDMFALIGGSTHFHLNSLIVITLCKYATFILEGKYIIEF